MATGERFVSIFEGGSALGLGPADLLQRFADRRDEGAFAALVDRHGPMVLATCRRILPDHADADDAFQATFLVLARKASSLSDPDRLAPWLHGVARRVAVRARSRSARRAEVEAERDGRRDQAVAPDAADAHELRAVLDEELARLPAKYRDPLVLCYLEGLTHDEAADQLDWPVGTVRSRLAGGRDRLRSRLTRRGFAPGALVVLSPATLPVSAVSRLLQAATVRLVFTGSAGKLAGPAALLAQGVLTSMFLAKVQTVAALAATTFAVATVGVVAAGPRGATEVKPTVPVPPPTAAPPARPGQSTPPSDLTKELDAAHDRIKTLEFELAKLMTDAQFGRILNEIHGEKPQPHKPVGAVTIPLEGGPVLYLPAERDRATLIDTFTGKSSNYKDPGNVKTIVPVASKTLVGLMLEGPNVTEVVAYSAAAIKWVRHPLRQPAKEGAITPVVNESLVWYAVDRSLYVLGAQDLEWAVLDLKEPLTSHTLPTGTILTSDAMIVPEGDTLHIHRFGSVGWTHASTRDDQEQAQPEAKPTTPRPTNALPADQPKAQIYPLKDNVKNLIIPVEQDRIIVGDKIYRIQGQVQRIVPVSSAAVVGLALQGAKITQSAAYDIKLDEWIPINLREPVIDGEIIPTVSPLSVEYRVGALIYHFVTQSHGWTITDLDNLPR